MNPDPTGAATGDAGRRGGLPIDGVLVPGFLILLARDVLLHDPHRVLAWRLLHEPLLAAVPAWVTPLLPRPTGAFDLDPLALLLGAIATALAAAYLLATLMSARPRTRAAILIAAGTLLVVVPTLAFVAMGFATGRPYGQDGGVVQLPLALDRILAGQSPYGADYSASMLGRQARVSEFWAAYGGNPILRHHAYLPGTDLLMMPFHLALRPLMGGFDSRIVTLLAYVAAALLAVRLVDGSSRRLAAAALVAVNPLVYWQQTFGANDLVMAALLLMTVWLARNGRTTAAAAVLGLACSTKQLAWPFAPFLLVHLSGIRGFGELQSGHGLRRLAKPCVVAAGVFLVVVAPVAALDFNAFWRDVVGYNVGLSGVDAYPLGGTPGLGFANLLIYAGRVSSLRQHVSFGPFYLLVVPIVLALLHRTMRQGRAAFALVAGGAALAASLYFSRVFHPNYLILAAVLVPVALLMGEELGADVIAVPLLLFATAVEIAEHEVFRGVWQELGPRAGGILGALAPRAGSELTRDPLGLGLSALLSGLAVVYLVAGSLGAGRRLRWGLTVAAVLSATLVPTALVVSAGQPGGPVRAQDPWLAGVVRSGDAATGTETEVVQAWSTSFRRDPPSTFAASPVSLGVPMLAAVLRAIPVGRDPRMVLLVVWAVLAVLVPRVAAVPLAWAAALLTPAAALGLVFGSPAVVLTCAVLLSGALIAAGRDLAAALIVGLVSAIVPEMLFAAPLVLLARPEPRVGRLAFGLLVGFGLLAVPGLAHDPGSLLTHFLLPVRMQPGVGLANLFVYIGAETSTVARACAWALPPVIAASALVWAWRRRGRYEPLSTTAAALLMGALSLPGFSPDGLAAPLALIALSGLRELRGIDARDDGPRAGNPQLG